MIGRDACAAVRIVAALGGLAVTQTQPLQAQKAIPVRALTPAVSTDLGVLKTINGVRALRSGGVIVSDGVAHRVILLDSTLSKVSVVLSGSEFGQAAGFLPGLIPYPGDTTVFVDVESQSLVVISPAGRVVRSMAPPGSRDYRLFGVPTVGVSSPFIQPAFDPKGRLVYRTNRIPAPSVSPPGIPDSGAITVSAAIDSAPVVRANLDSRTVDTIVMLRIPVIKHVTMALGGGRTVTATLWNPTPSADDGTLLPDGTIALVRGKDYHVDWVHPDGSVTSTPKMPFDWRRFTREEKQRILDSATKAAAARRASAPPPAPGSPVFTQPPFMTVKLEDLPDYYPPIRPGQVRADPDGNVWILPSTSSLSTPDAPGLVFDVVNRKGEIFERVRLPAGRNLVGLGRDGVVYMSYWTSSRGQVLERARILQ